MIESPRSWGADNVRPAPASPKGEDSFLRPACTARRSLYFRIRLRSCPSRSDRNPAWAEPTQVRTPSQIARPLRRSPSTAHPGATVKQKSPVFGRKPQVGERVDHAIRTGGSIRTLKPFFPFVDRRIRRRTARVKPAHFDHRFGRNRASAVHEHDTRRRSRDRWRRSSPALVWPKLARQASRP